GNGLPGDHPGKDPQVGLTLSSPQGFTCGEVSEILGLANGFQAKTKYYAVSGPNSNTWMNWMLNAAGIASYFPLPPAGAWGWDAPINGWGH
ncbi:MAG TPA: hypothetical protein VLY04_12075, partial [Bryobacteraceae bacterium]|nr:hypothetical protein [Bryobacteraceae bacterium]